MITNGMIIRSHVFKWETPSSQPLDDEFMPMPTHTTSTLSLWTVTVRLTFLLMTWESTCGTWQCLTKVLVSSFFSSFSLPPFLSFCAPAFHLWLCADIVDIKPANMEELTEVITSAEFHPQHCNIFMYSSSKGTIKLADMRQSALCDNHAKGTLHCFSLLSFIKY